MNHVQHNNQTSWSPLFFTFDHSWSTSRGCQRTFSAYVSTNHSYSSYSSSSFSGSSMKMCLICDILDQNSPTCGWHFLHSSGQPTILNLSSAVRWWMLSGRDISFGQSDISSALRLVRVDSHSGSISRLSQFLMNKVCKELAVSWSHWGKATSCGKPQNPTHFNFSMGLRSSWWSFQRSKSRLTQSWTNRSSF